LPVVDGAYGNRADAYTSSRPWAWWSRAAPSGRCRRRSRSPLLPRI